MTWNLVSDSWTCQTESRPLTFRRYTPQGDHGQQTNNADNNQKTNESPTNIQGDNRTAKTKVYSPHKGIADEHWHCVCVCVCVRQ